MIFRSRPPYLSITDLIIASILLILLVIMGGCAPALNAIAGDEAELVYVTNVQEGPCAPAPNTGLCFVPGEEAASDINVNVLYDQLDAIADFCTPSENGHNCKVEVASEPTFILVNGTDVTASVRYRRAGSNRWYTEFTELPD